MTAWIDATSEGRAAQYRKDQMATRQAEREARRTETPVTASELQRRAASRAWRPIRVAI